MGSRTGSYFLVILLALALALFLTLSGAFGTSCLVRWGPNGTAVDINHSDGLQVHSIAPDGAGGVFVNRYGYVQRIDAAGTNQWAEPVYIQARGDSVSDGAGGAIIVSEGGLAHRVDRDGNLLWGLPLS